MLVSVCLPTYNGGEFFENSLQSVLEQTHLDLEILISDDGSDDGTFEYAEEMAEKDDRIRLWRNEARLGIFQNYNECLRRARGEYIKPFAQDDSLTPTAIEAMVEALKDNEVALVCSAKSSAGKAAYQLDEEVETLDSGHNVGKDVIKKSLLTYRNLVGEPVAVLFDARHVGSGFNDSYFSLGDIEYWFRILERGDCFYIDQPLVQFRSHPASATAKILADMTWVLDFFRLGKDYRKYLQELGVSDEEYANGFIDNAGLLLDKLIRDEAGTHGGTSGAINASNLSGFKEVAIVSMRRAAQLAAKAREYDAVVSSTSWKLTGPLRNLKEKINKKDG